MEFHIQKQKSILWIFFHFYYPILEKKNMLLHLVLREDLSHKKEKTEGSALFKLKFKKMDIQKLKVYNLAISKFIQQIFVENLHMCQELF